MRLAKILGLGMTLVALATGAGSAMPEATSSEVQQKFADIDRQWLDAEKRGDFPYIEKFFADSYVLITFTGQVFTKREWLDFLQGPSHPTMEIVHPQDIRVQVFGDVAILTDHTTLKGHDGLGHVFDGEFRVMRVLLKQNEEWKAAGVSMRRVQ